MIAGQMWGTDSRWFDIAAFMTVWVVLALVFGRFEQHKAAWRRLLKCALVLVLLLVLVETAGRLLAYAAIGLLLLAGAVFHFALMSKLGINGWTGEPRERFDPMVRDIELHGEAQLVRRVARDLLSSRN